MLESKKPKTHETNGSGYQFDAALGDLGFDWESESLNLADEGAIFEREQPDLVVGRRKPASWSCKGAPLEKSGAEEGLMVFGVGKDGIFRPVPGRRWR